MLMIKAHIFWYIGNIQNDSCIIFIFFQVALVSVVHIQDDQCSLPSGIIAQYLKQANGHLSCLKVSASFLYTKEILKSKFIFCNVVVVLIFTLTAAQFLYHIM